MEIAWPKEMARGRGRQRESVGDGRKKKGAPWSPSLSLSLLLLHFLLKTRMQESHQEARTGTYDKKPCAHQFPTPHKLWIKWPLCQIIWQLLTKRMKLRGMLELEVVRLECTRIIYNPVTLHILNYKSMDHRLLNWIFRWCNSPSNCCVQMWGQTGFNEKVSSALWCGLKHEIQPKKCSWLKQISAVGQCVGRAQSPNDFHKHFHLRPKEQYLRLA